MNAKWLLSTIWKTKNQYQPIIKQGRAVRYTEDFIFYEKQKIGLISDIHGNYEALKAVLEELDKMNDLLRFTA